MTLEDISNKLGGEQQRINLDKLLDEISPKQKITPDEKSYEIDPSIAYEINNLSLEVEGTIATHEIKKEQDNIIKELLSNEELLNTTKKITNTKDIGNPQEGLPIVETDERFKESQYVINRRDPAQKVETLAKKGYISSGASYLLKKILGIAA